MSVSSPVIGDTNHATIFTAADAVAPSSSWRSDPLQRLLDT